jgi:hypothetical protein
MNKRKRTQVDYKLLDSLSSSNPEDWNFRFLSQPQLHPFEKLKKMHGNKTNVSLSDDIENSAKTTCLWKERILNSNNWRLADESVVEFVSVEQLTLDRIKKTGFRKPIFVVDGAARLQLSKENFTVDTIVQLVGTSTNTTKPFECSLSFDTVMNSPHMNNNR